MSNSKCKHHCKDTNLLPETPDAFAMSKGPRDMATWSNTGIIVVLRQSSHEASEYLWLDAELVTCQNIMFKLYHFIFSFHGLLGGLHVFLPTGSLCRLPERGDAARPFHPQA